MSADRAVAIKAEIKGYQLKNKLIGMVRQALAEVEHRQRVDRSLVTAFEKLYPLYTISLVRQSGLFQLSVWGNGVEYNDRLYLVTNESLVSRDGWAAIRAELDNMDMSDYIAQAEHDLTVLPELDEIDRQIAALREKALEIARFDSDKLRTRGVSYTVRHLYKFLD
jgi:hypothetical protein